MLREPMPVAGQLISPLRWCFEVFAGHRSLPGTQKNNKIQQAYRTLKIINKSKTQKFKITYRPTFRGWVRKLLLFSISISTAIETFRSVVQCGGVHCCNWQVPRRSIG